MKNDYKSSSDFLCDLFPKMTLEFIGEKSKKEGIFTSNEWNKISVRSYMNTLERVFPDYYKKEILDKIKKNYKFR